MSARLRALGWTPRGGSTVPIKGARCAIVIATRAKFARSDPKDAERRSGEMIAEVRSFDGYVRDFRDMAELKGTAQGLGEMGMITVIVRGDPAATDALYQELMGAPPERHGSGRGPPTD